jgi:hypothetical protein
MARLGSKQPYEEYFVSFDFTNVLGSASVATANVIVYDSTNATCTSAITTVANQTLATTAVNIWIKGGVTDNEYKITCEIETNSTPAEKYELDAVLPVAEL